MPFAKKAYQTTELLAENTEKKSLLESKKKKISWESKMTDDDRKAYARLEKNKHMNTCIEQERIYNTIYNTYKQIEIAIINTRISLKVMP